MTEYNVTASTPVLVAIDISKGRHEVLIEVPDKKLRRRVSVLNTLDEFARLITLLRSFQRPVRVAFEATGNYHRALAFQLGAADFNIKLVSSVALARTREALHNSWDKNDPKDAHSDRQLPARSRRGASFPKQSGLLNQRATDDGCHAYSDPLRETPFEAPWRNSVLSIR